MNDIVLDKAFFVYNKRIFIIWVVVLLFIMLISMLVSISYRIKAQELHVDIHANGVATTAYLYKTLCSSGRRGGSDDAYYRRVVNGKTYTHNLTGGCNNPPKTINIYYLPDKPYKYLTEYEYARGVRSLKSYLWGSALVSALFFVVFLGHIMMMTFNYTRDDVCGENRKINKTNMEPKEK